MAIITPHPAFSGISGTNGGMVFRQLQGKVVVAQRPDTRDLEPSPAQQAQRDRFTLAAAYAREVLSHPWQRRMYERLAASRNRRVDKLLMSDFLTPPVVDEIDVSVYHRRAGDLVRIIASDDIEVTGVDVAIHTAAGALVEQGHATSVHGVWCYRTVTASPLNELVVVSAVARDRPGNEARQMRLCS